MNIHLSFEHYSTFAPVGDTILAIEPARHPVETTVDLMPGHYTEVYSRYCSGEKAFQIRENEKQT